MRVCHNISAVFDDPDLIGAAGLVPVMALADKAGLPDLVRHGGMNKLFSGSRAPTTLGTHLRAYTFGHVRQLDAVASRVLVNLAGIVPGLLAGADQVVYLDVDDTIRATHGYAKEGVGYGYTGLNQGPERAGRDAVHTDRGTGARRHEAA